MHVLCIFANELEHRVLEWPAEGDPRGTVLLLHGYMDAAGTFDIVAPILAKAGFRVVAPDLRGFGGGARVPRSAVYHFPDYVFDVADLADALAPDEKLLLVGHSMGGTVATLYAGAFPERVRRLALCEGLGPPTSTPEEAPLRMRRWIDDVRKVRAAGPPRAIGTFDEAVRRVVANHAKVDAEVARSRAKYLVKNIENTKEGLVYAATPNEEFQPSAAVTWAYDPLHKTVAPTPFFADVYRAFARQVTCEVLLLSGGADGYRLDDEEARALAFERARVVLLSSAGHMMHWTKPNEVARELLAYFDAEES